MSRAEQRIKRKLEKNPVVECNRIQKKYCPTLFQEFQSTTDTRNQGYVEYSNKTMLGTLYYKGIAGIVSMQGMTYEFNQENITSNLLHFLGEDDKEFLPHGVTLNEYLEKLDPKEVQEIQQKLVYQMIRRKTFDDSRFQKSWLVLVDGTQLYSGNRKINEHCLEKCYNKGTDEEKTNYHINVLEAKILLNDKVIVSIGSEFIENKKRPVGMSDEDWKQDCELKAFKRLMGKIKKKFPRLPITLLLDSLYAADPVMTMCAKNNWNYIIRYKAGSIPSIAEEYENIPEKVVSGNTEYINGIGYKSHEVNVLRQEEKLEGGVRTFQWITNIKLTQNNAEKVAKAGRKRWKIENEGFNRQKNWQGDITHACSHKMETLKNHYLMQQIADMIKQLYEWYFLEANEIKKKQKNISSDLLSSFAGQLTREDISSTETHSVTIN